MINNSNFSLCDIDCPKCRSVAKLLDYFLEDKEIVECPVCGYQWRGEKKSWKSILGVFRSGLYLQYVFLPGKSRSARPNG